MSGRWSSPIHRLANVCIDQALSRPVDDDAAAFAARKGTLRMAVRVARRAVQLRCSGQRRLQRDSFDPAWRRILWIHEGMPQIGDALMDLAPRSLLTESGIAVDLYAPRHIAEMFENDAWFSRSLHRPDDVHADRYDAAIVLSNDRKALNLKGGRLAALPWMSLHGDYDGPDFHRGRFATQRLFDLLKRVPDPADMARHSAQKLAVTPRAAAAAEAACPASDAVALVLGGVWAERTYHRWPELIAALQARGHSRFMLLGGANGRQMADELLTAADPGVQLSDFVGRTTLLEAHALLARSVAAVCADGGLMHVALTTSTPVISLFGAAIDPRWRLPIGREGRAIQATDAGVDSVSPQALAGVVAAAIAAGSAPVAAGALGADARVDGL